MPETVEQRLAGMGLALPAQCTPRGNFLPYHREGSLVFMAGQICEWNGDVPYRGPVLAPGQDAPDGGETQTVEAGYEAARMCALNLLYHLRDAADGDFGRIKGFVRVGGFVNCLSGFDSSPAVINGASDLFIQLWGEAGRHARTAVGVSGLPGNASVEVDAVIALRA